MKAAKTRIAIVGGGPSGLFTYKRLVEANRTDFTVEIFEIQNELGSGMPYSRDGSKIEHVTNVSGNEIPNLPLSLKDWLRSLSTEELSSFDFKADDLIDYRVLPRLLFGKYLKSQFDALLEKGRKAGIPTTVHLGSKVTDLSENQNAKTISVTVNEKSGFDFDFVIICTGHHWPKTHEQNISGYFDSPYPPSKLAGFRNHRIAIRGSSLTAIDAVRTLARNHGTFHEDEAGKISFQPNENADEFKLVLHSREGFLPAVRFHLEDPHLSKVRLISKELLRTHMAENGGFVSLDFVFDKDFKEAFREKEPAFFEFIKTLALEQFVEKMLDQRENVDPFELLKQEYAEAWKSIDKKRSIYWKEMLAVLSFALNYPAKYFSAEDMLRMQKVLMPLISVVIAFAPQRSCEELIALHDAGRLNLIAVGTESKVEVTSKGEITYHYTDQAGTVHETPYLTFVDCVGQPHLSFDQFPFKSLVASKTVSPARLRFRSPSNNISANEKNTVKINGEAFLKVPGIAINDFFQPIDPNGYANPQLYIMAVPHIGGFNPDYSGLDFCEEGSKTIVEKILSIL